MIHPGSCIDPGEDTSQIFVDRVRLKPIISVNFFLQLRTVDDLEYSVETTKGKRPHRGGLFPVSTRSSAGVSVRKVHYSSPRLIEVETWK